MLTLYQPRQRLLDLERILGEYAASHEEESSFYLGRAWIAFLLACNSAFHDIRDAVADLDRVIQLDIMRSEAFLLRGEMRTFELTEATAARSELLSRIQADYEAALQREPTSGRAWIDTIELRLLRHDWDGAISAFGESLPYMRTREEQIVRSLLGCFALAMAGEQIEDADIDPLRNPELEDGTQGDGKKESRTKRKVDFVFSELLPRVLKLRLLTLADTRNSAEGEAAARLLRDSLRGCGLGDYIDQRGKKADLKHYEAVVESRPFKKGEVPNYWDQKRTLEELAGRDDPEAWYGRGVLQLRCERFDEALRALAEVVVRDPDGRGLGLNAMFVKALALEKWRRYPEAVCALDDLIRCPAVDSALCALAWGKKAEMNATLAYKLELRASWEVLYFRTRSETEAIVEAALEDDLDLAARVRRVGGRVRGGDPEAKALWEQAVDCWKKSVALKPALAEAWAGMGHALRWLGRKEEALAAYEAALAARPYYAILSGAAAEAWCWKAELLREFGRAEEALEAYEMCRELDWNRDYSIQNLRRAEILNALGRHREALDALDAFPRSEVDGRALRLRAAICACMGHLDQAIEAYDQATEKLAWYQREQAQCLESKAQLLERLGRDREACRTRAAAADANAASIASEREDADKWYTLARKWTGGKVPDATPDDVLRALRNAVDLDRTMRDRIRIDPVFQSLQAGPAFKRLADPNAW